MRLRYAVWNIMPLMKTFRLFDLNNLLIELEKQIQRSSHV